jgi:hypothetical protein
MHNSAKNPLPCLEEGSSWVLPAVSYGAMVVGVRPDCQENEHFSKHHNKVFDQEYMKDSLSVLRDEILRHMKDFFVPVLLGKLLKNRR